MRTLITLAELPYLAPTEILSALQPGGIEHFALLTERHIYGLPPTVISASKVRQAVVEEFPLEFTLGMPIYAHGVWSDQPWRVTISNARSQLGVQYRLFDRNCEHFVRYCHGQPQESPQLATAVRVAIVGALASWMLAA